MFGWFKNIAKTDPVAMARGYAESAVIESVFDKGLYSAFLIRLPADSQPTNFIKNQAALSAFVERVEARLVASDFEPVLEVINRDIYDALGPSASDHSADRASALRAVISHDDALLFKWNG
jgi:hypothetical protein